ncbi:MAG: DsbA family protein [Caulobacteraceae bacterium]
MRPIAALAICLGLAFALAACGPKGGGGGAALPDDMSMGAPNAKVTVIEYASLGCPHCAVWNNEVFPAFKAKYVDTGKVRYVLREFLTGDPQVAAAGFLLARCAGKDKYFQVVDEVFRQQADMYQPGNSPRNVLLKIAQSAGLTEPQFDACVNNDAALKALNDRVERYAKQDHIDATPTYVINGKVYDNGDMSMAELDKAIAQAEAGVK